MTAARSISATLIGHASGWRSETWEPRAAASRGEPSEKPSGASQASWSATMRSVMATDFARIAAMPASAVSLTPSSTAASSRIGGVPAWKRPMPSTGS